MLQTFRHVLVHRHGFSGVVRPTEIDPAGREVIDPDAVPGPIDQCPQTEPSHYFRPPRHLHHHRSDRLGDRDRRENACVGAQMKKWVYPDAADLEIRPQRC